MSTGQTPLARARWRRPIRPGIDKDTARYFVYFLRDADGVPVYIGRSCDVAARIRAHHANIDHPGIPEDRRTTWLLDCRSVSMLGPFTWDEAVARERAEIERHQPRANRDLTARDRRPAVAARSARAAS